MRYFCLGAGFGPFFLSCLGFIPFLSFFVALFPFPMIFSIDIEGRFEPTPPVTIADSHGEKRSVISTLFAEQHLATFCSPKFPEISVAFTTTEQQLSGYSLCRFLKILAVGVVVLWMYCGSDWKPQASFVKWAASQEGKPWHESVNWLANHATIFQNAGESLMYQIKHNIRGHGVYFWGDWSKRALWYYFPVAMTVKLTTIVLLTLIFCLTKPRSYLTPLNLISLLLLVFSLNCRVQIGIRLIFPLLAFVLLTASVALSRRVDLWNHGYKWLALAIFGALNIYPAWITWPDGLRYANELWGGPENVHHILSDSNSDWGQGLIDLDRTAQQMGLPLPRVSYYGTDPKVQTTS